MTTSSWIDVNLIRAWLKEAGGIALSQLAELQVELKPDLTPVTQIDHQAETFLIEHILKHYPGHGLLAEDGSTQTGSELIGRLTINLEQPLKDLAML